MDPRRDQSETKASEDKQMGKESSKFRQARAVDNRILQQEKEERQHPVLGGRSGDFHHFTPCGLVQWPSSPIVEHWRMTVGSHPTDDRPGPALAVWG